METHALFGATGATGSAILTYLLDTRKSPLRLNIYVRSDEKLRSMFPDLTRNSNVHINVVCGQLSDPAKIEEALNNVILIYNCVSTNMPTRGASTAQVVAQSIISALGRLRSKNGDNYRPPTLLMNRAMPLNHNLGEPSTMENFILWVLKYVYDDLREAVKLYESAAADDLLKYVLVDAPSLHEAPNGERTGHELVRKGHLKPALYYSDLGAAFVEIGERRQEFEGSGVGVSATGHVQTNFPALMWYWVIGIRARLFG